MEFNSNRQLILAGIKPDEPEMLKEGVSENKAETLVETHLRKAIRSEIEAIVQEIRAKNDSGWMFRGQKKPGHSRSGKVTMGLLGLGFANGEE